MPFACVIVMIVFISKMATDLTTSLFTFWINFFRVYIIPETFTPCSIKNSIFIMKNIINFFLALKYKITTVIWIVFNSRKIFSRTNFFVISNPGLKLGLGGRASLHKVSVKVNHVPHRHKYRTYQIQIYWMEWMARNQCHIWRNMARNNGSSQWQVLVPEVSFPPGPRIYRLPGPRTGQWPGPRLTLFQDLADWLVLVVRRSPILLRKPSSENWTKNFFNWNFWDILETFWAMNFERI